MSSTTCRALTDARPSPAQGPVLLGGGGGFCAAGAASSGRRRSDPGGQRAAGAMPFFAPTTWGEIRSFMRRIRTGPYTENNRHSGTAAYRTHDARGAGRAGMATIATAFASPLACRYYDVRHAVSRGLHAIARNRILTGLALGYMSDRHKSIMGCRVKILARAGALWAVAALNRAARKTLADGFMDRAWKRPCGHMDCDWCCPGGSPAERQRGELIACRNSRRRSTGTTHRSTPWQNLSPGLPS